MYSIIWFSLISLLLIFTGIPVKLVHYASSIEQPNIKTLISNDQIDLVVNLPTAQSILTPENLQNNFLTRRTAVDFGVPLLTNPQLFKMFAEALVKHHQGKFSFTKVSSKFWVI